ncbi:hypothetical protein [Aquimarina sp. 2201CG5-10]|uniref:hypothetical protein n=1 Tax=Aquimarina callyspongiae TaxID=3098150 RepID=UPI002AB4E264|nr:hypothetical protein [Aquimarina sp. 2201CG5-10]MDY8137620.1 hypothetical protein [Aquimarina sp. 2201CG5-10]
MKKFRNQWIIASLITGAFFIISCEKSDTKTEIFEIQEEEGFKSSTGNQDQVLNIGEEEIQQPLLHMSFGKEISEEEAELHWNNAVKEYMRKNPIQNRDYSTNWGYTIRTYTGTQIYNNTNGLAQASVSFYTSAGTHHTGYVDLDNPGNDRQRGQYDYYLFRTSIIGQAVSWVEVNNAHLRLEGTNGWFVKEFNVYVLRYDQTVPASGSSYIITAPNIWLDNENPNGWDYYNTLNIGIGRLTF